MRVYDIICLHAINILPILTSELTILHSAVNYLAVKSSTGCDHSVKFTPERSARRVQARLNVIYRLRVISSPGVELAVFFCNKVNQY